MRGAKGEGEAMNTDEQPAIRPSQMPTHRNPDIVEAMADGWLALWEGQTIPPLSFWISPNWRVCPPKEQWPC